MTDGTVGPRTEPEAPDPLEALDQQLTGLGAAPVGEHPDVLEAVHRALVHELDTLAGEAARNRG